MRFALASVFAVLAAVPAMVSAQTNHLIRVGAQNGSLTYEPTNITAAMGDTVTFEFHQKNHTVTQSTFANPCTPMVNATTNTVGFKSGFIAVSDNATSFPQWTLQINTTAPIWFFCAQGKHCQNGMVGSINAVETGPNNFAAYKAKALSLLNGNTTTGTPGANGGSGTPTSGNGTAGATPSTAAGGNPPSAREAVQMAGSVVVAAAVAFGAALML